MPEFTFSLPVNLVFEIKAEDEEEAREKLREDLKLFSGGDGMGDGMALGWNRPGESRGPVFHFLDPRVYLVAESLAEASIEDVWEE